jgi:hypothetical protein
MAYSRDGDEALQDNVNNKFIQPESIIHLLSLPDVNKHRFNKYHVVDTKEDDISNYLKKGERSRL